MKRIDDQNIIKEIKNDATYQIKTSSEDILRQYNLEISKEKSKVNNDNKKKLFVFGGLGGVGVCAIAVAASIFVTFNSNSNDNNNDNPFTPSIVLNNISFKEELATYSYFNGTNDSGLLLNKAMFARGQNGNRDLTQTDFNNICKTYDDVEVALEKLGEQVNVKGYEFNNEKEGTYYKYVNSLYIDNNETPFASMYFNDINMIEDDDEVVTTYKALYETNGIYSDLFVKKEVESEDKEKEISYVLTFKPINNSDYFYVIERESEIKGVETEEAYSYAVYNSNNSRNYLYKLTYEVENELDGESIELEIEKNDAEYSYENIQIRGKSTTFIASYESGDHEIEDVYVTLTKENGKKQYASRNGLIYNS